MGALVAADVTVTPVPRLGRRLVEGIKQVFADISFGDGAKTYPTNGIPLPAVGVFGLREIAFAEIEEANGYKYVFDRANHKLKMYCVAAGTPAGSTSSVSGGTPVFTGTEANLTGDAQAYTPAGTIAALAGHSHTFTGTAVDAAPLGEVPNTHAPAATTLRLKLLGV